MRILLFLVSLAFWMSQAFPSGGTFAQDHELSAFQIGSAPHTLAGTCEGMEHERCPAPLSRTTTPLFLPLASSDAGHLTGKVAAAHMAPIPAIPPPRHFS